MILGSPANPLPFFNLERVRAMSLSCLVKTIFLFFLFAELVVTSLAVTTPVKGVSSGARVRKTRLHRFQSSEIHENAVVTQATTSRPVTGFDESPIIYYFDQLIDHNNPSLGTFTQRYWQSWEWYKPGGPIILYTAGEGNSEPTAVYDISNSMIQGVLAQALNGAIISIEHRFFGESNPYPDLTAKNLAVHTVAQSIQDMANFALTVKLAMPGGDTDAIRPHNTPWVFVGGSYSGALTTYILNKEPHIFWAGYSSSGVVQPIADFWQYFEPIREYMPQNCSADVEAVMKYVDSVIGSNDQSAINELMTYFSLGNSGSIFNFLDFMEAPLQQWQELKVSSTGFSRFYEFCDALEVQNGQIAPETGWGLNVALQAWAYYFAASNLLTSVSYGGATVNAEVENTLQHDENAWLWMVCNEFGFVQKGPPPGFTGPAIAPEQLLVSYYDEHCQQTFPGAFASNTIADRVAITASTYQGWNVSSDRLFVVTGTRDPWLYATFSAPSQNITSSDSRPINLGDGFHCSDLSIQEGLFSPTISEIQKRAVTTFASWVANFTPNTSTVATTVAPIMMSTPTAQLSSSSPSSSASTENINGKSGAISMKSRGWRHVIALSVALAIQLVA